MPNSTGYLTGYLISARESHPGSLESLVIGDAYHQNKINIPGIVLLAKQENRHSFEEYPI